MTTLDDLLKKARTAPAAHRDVDLILDTETANQIGDLEQELAALATDLRFSDPRPLAIREQIEALQAKAGESLVTLRFTRLPGREWAELSARSVQRPDVAIDAAYGYNYHDVAQEAATSSGMQLHADGTTTALTGEQWAALFEVLSGHEFERLCSTVWELNEYEPQQRIAAAGKASRAGSATSSTSPSISE